VISARRFLPLLGGVALCGWIALRGHPPEQAAGSSEPPKPATANPLPRSHTRLAGEWQELIAICEKDGDPAATKKRLAATKERWLVEDPQVLAGVIGQLLSQGDDAVTGIPFETGPGGALRGWPTLRVFLLDVLAVTDPDLAGVIAREVLASTTSAEEFAVALKPLLLGGPWQAPATELEGYFAKLLENPAWQDKVGLAEALDVSRVAALPGTTTTLARWVDRSPPAAEAGIMALHETAAAHPGLMVDLIVNDSTSFDSSPALRASLLSRAAVSDPKQAAGIESYLRDPAVPVSEKQQFLELFPLRSASTGYRLYGNPPSPFSDAAVRADDRAALEAAGRWRSDPALVELGPEIQGLERRLQGWIRQAGN
jgi:hypothetical protein